ncbi:hypothetical protein PoB_006679100 [Plakobranchus ocellatus]|uniref:Uncharacterized protein n=1 Tax=Plakobranchus ocellatus TaxID=259542 RepID=A0AAV4D805_9GAST|nr:hypothetical protein PoB_006679100 [Plakobranchus ocellatus]
MIQAAAEKLSKEIKKLSDRPPGVRTEASQWKCCRKVSQLCYVTYIIDFFMIATFITIMIDNSSGSSEDVDSVANRTQNHYITTISYYLPLLSKSMAQKSLF